MKFLPKTEEQIQAELVIEPGIYNFEVAYAKDRLSKNGNDMIEMQLKVWDKNGQERVVYDYLLEAMHFKLIHFCDATGLRDDYQTGDLEAADCMGRCGRVELIVQTDKSNQYPPKNAVKDYLTEDKDVNTLSGMKPLPHADNQFQDSSLDDLPF